MDSRGSSNDGWWSDEEWRRWRLQQQDSASGKQGADPDKKLSLKQERIREKDNFVQKQLADAASLLSSSSSSSSSGGLKFQMPTEWTVTIFTADEKDRNEKKKQQSFADLQRLANNRLKAMYQCWQSEATTLKLQGGTLLMDSRQKTGEQEAKMEALETELKKLRNEVKEKDFKLLAHEKLKDNHTAECDKKVREMSEECEQKLAAQAKRHELDLAEKTNECQRLLASEKEASEKTLAEQAKSFEGKIEMVTMKLEAKALAEAEARHAALTKHGLFRARAAHSMEKWRERCGNLERRLNAKKAVLRTMNLEKELFQDLLAKRTAGAQAASPTTGGPSAAPTAAVPSPSDRFESEAAATADEFPLDLDFPPPMPLPEGPEMTMKPVPADDEDLALENLLPPTSPGSPTSPAEARSRSPRSTRTQLPE